MSCCNRKLLIILLCSFLSISFAIYVLINRMSKNSFFYCWLFDRQKFFIPNTFDSFEQLLTEKLDVVSGTFDSNLAFDIIIIGAGTAGSVVANRLSEKYPNSSVLVIEAGNNGNGQMLVEIPGVAPMLWSNSYGNFTWDYVTEPQKNLLNRSLILPAGKLLGGTSSINFMIYSQMVPTVFETWSRLSNCENWNWNNVYEYFPQIQYDSVVQTRSTKLGKIWQDASKEIDMKFKLLERNMKMFIKNGMRWNMVKDHLYAASKRPNVYILKNAHVEKLLFSIPSNQYFKSNVYGVEVVDNNGNTNTIYSKDKVILSAGTIQNVRILHDSFKLTHDSYGVHPSANEFIGNNFKDHLFLPLFFEIEDSQVYGYSSGKYSLFKYFLDYLFNSQGPLAQTIADGGPIYLDTENNDTQWSIIQFSPNLQLALISSVVDPISLEAIFSKYLDSISFDIYTKMFNKEKTRSGFTIFVILVKPKSEGYVNYNSSFKINPNYLSHPDDMISVLKGIKFALNLVFKTRAFSAIKVSSIKPSNDDMDFINRCRSFNNEYLDSPTYRSLNDTDFDTEYWTCYTKHLIYSMFHYFGTATFGNETGSSVKPVVDCNLKYVNSNNLYIVDASVVPEPVSGGPQSTVMMIAEKFIKENF